jgi:hypothetical protein
MELCKAEQEQQLFIVHHKQNLHCNCNYCTYSSKFPLLNSTVVYFEPKFARSAARKNSAFHRFHCIFGIYSVFRFISECSATRKILCIGQNAEFYIFDFLLYFEMLCIFPKLCIRQSEIRNAENTVPAERTPNFFHFNLLLFQMGPK